MKIKYRKPTLIEQMNEAIETVILEAPEQFIWSYNRYKHPEGAELPPKD